MADEELQAVGDRIERLLDELQAAIVPRAYEQVEELVRLVTELYGGAIARMLEIVGKAAPGAVGSLVADDLVASVLVLHDLHPDALEARVEGALEDVRPFLRGHDGDVELLGIDAAAGAVHLRLLGSCDGCPSSSVTLQMAVERAINKAAPEIAIIDVEANDPLVVPAGTPGGGAVPVALGRRHQYDACPSEVAEVAAG